MLVLGPWMTVGSRLSAVSRKSMRFSLQAWPLLSSRGSEPNLLSGQRWQGPPGVPMPFTPSGLEHTGGVTLPGSIGLSQ